MKPATSNLACSCGLLKPIIISQIRGFPFNISAKAEASDFKFSTLLGFAKSHHKITLREKKWGFHWARGTSQNFGFPYNISATARATDFEFGALLEFAKTHQKITRRRKGGRGPGLGELPNIWGFPFSIYTMAEASDFKFGIGTQLVFAKAHHK